MDFKQLQSFVTVVEQESFTKAAERLFVSQPTVSAHVRALEEELGCRLILRTTKNIEITQKGREVYACALSMLDMKERMQTICQPEENRIIRLAASTIPSAYILPGILPEFGRRYPHLYFSISHADSQRVIDGISEGKYDLGFASKPGDARMKSIPIATDRMVLITPVTEYYLNMRERGPVTLDQIVSEPIIMREEREQKQADHYFERLGVDKERLHIVARVNDQEMVKNLVSAGMGVSLISGYAARDFVKAKRVREFELPHAAQKRIYLLYRRQEETRHIRDFVRFVRTMSDREEP